MKTHSNNPLPKPTLCFLCGDRILYLFSALQHSWCQVWRQCCSCPCALQFRLWPSGALQLVEDRGHRRLLKLARQGPETCAIFGCNRFFGSTGQFLPVVHSRHQICTVKSSFSGRIPMKHTPKESTSMKQSQHGWNELLRSKDLQTISFVCTALFACKVDCQVQSRPRNKDHFKEVMSLRAAMLPTTGLM